MASGGNNQDWSLTERWKKGFEKFREYSQQETIISELHADLSSSLATHLRELFSKERQVILLDLGCGYGSDSAALIYSLRPHLRENPHKLQYIGVDISQSYAEKAVKYLSALGSEASYLVGDMYADETIQTAFQQGRSPPDIINISHSAYYTPDVVPFVQSINKRMKPDSFAIFSHGESTTAKLKAACKNLRMPHYQLERTVVDIPYGTIIGADANPAIWKEFWEEMLLARPIDDQNSPIYEQPGFQVARNIIEFRTRGALEDMDQAKRAAVLYEVRANVEQNNGRYLASVETDIVLPAHHKEIYEEKLLRAVNEVRNKRGKTSITPSFSPLYSR